ncbi:hypothetical protein Poli38472_010326 [Pythium oligandrum]|uniref:protein-tyrosine-phosphatase n=1 Tax=Pythium oligandrum TaxID=41045 RepID=A0A8K1C2Y8_PYTOL|nr:hypothetical protein Poli38472_010326 [Pythium oligandrum]|eukprot:TMW55444.1 hypothetical protein Poli38472_010326 [Pythium oligandrum]
MTLLALFLVICHNRSPEDTIKPFQTLKPAFGFRDAACGVGTFFISILDCALAVHKAMKAGIWNYGSFSLDEYEHYDQLHHGDINWIIPGKILAFSGPQQERIVLDEKGSTTLLAHDYAKVFQKLGVSCVVRFNEPSTYDRRAFVQANIRHLDMLYPDGGNPPDEILHKFLRTCERESGAIAVHCKAGLGRTGTNIAAYLMKHYHFSAVEAIAWCRICRPGSIIRQNPIYFVEKEKIMVNGTLTLHIRRLEGMPEVEADEKQHIEGMYYVVRVKIGALDHRTQSRGKGQETDMEQDLTFELQDVDGRESVTIEVLDDHDAVLAGAEIATVDELIEGCNKEESYSVHGANRTASLTVSSKWQVP